MSGIDAGGKTPFQIDMDQVDAAADAAAAHVDPAQAGSDFIPSDLGNVAAQDIQLAIAAQTGIMLDRMSGFKPESLNPAEPPAKPEPQAPSNPNPHDFAVQRPQYNTPVTTPEPAKPTATKPAAPSTPVKAPKPVKGPTPPKDAGKAIHTVKKGDTIWGIAEGLKAKGHKGSVNDIMHKIIRMNPEIANPDLIHPGDKIKIPGGKGDDDGVKAPAKPSKGDGPKADGPKGPGKVDAADVKAAKLSHQVMDRAKHIGDHINATGGYRFDGQNDCYGFVRRVWDPVLEGLGKHKLPVADVGSSSWAHIDWNKLKPGDVLSTAQGHKWGADWHGGIFAGMKGGVPHIYDNSGSKSAQMRPLPDPGYFSYYYKPVHNMLDG